MKQKLADIEVLLLETRREADEYQKSIIERNADVAELERKVCQINRMKGKYSREFFS